MNVLLIRILISYIDNDVILKLGQLGHHVRTADLSALKTGDMYHNDRLHDEALRCIGASECDVVYTSNFFPIIAAACHELDIPYISWQYDTPPNLTSEDEMEHSTNRIFFFNVKDYEHYKSIGLDSVYYLPLAVNCDKRQRFHLPDEAYGCDVSLVGKLYESTFPMLEHLMPEYYKGFMQGIIAGHRDMQGVFLPDELIDDELMRSINSAMGESISRRQLLYSLATYMTYLDRMLLLRLFSGHFDTVLYTGDISDKDRKLLDGTIIKGPVDYDTGMPLVFFNSRINLCPILRNNLSGIPLRALDVMSCRGFLLANYQCGLEEAFENGTELVMYHSAAEALELAAFYLEHDDLRKKIADRGFEKVLSDYRYEDRLKVMFDSLSR